MVPLILSTLMLVLNGQDGRVKNDAQLLLDTIASLQEPVEDFRCEFEGTVRLKGKNAQKARVGERGLFESFSGVFIWKKGGDTYSDILHRKVADSLLARETLVVRVGRQQAEQYHRLNDASLGYAVIRSPKEANSWQTSCLGSIFLIDKIKRDVADERLEASVQDDLLDGRQLKVLNIAIKGVPDSVFFRYWIDLKRSGHVVRHEGFRPGRILLSRLDIKLAPFKVRDAEVWMPVAGDYLSYADIGDKQSIVVKEPALISAIYVVGGSLEFNKRPGPEVFAVKYKPGTPISDNLRKLTYEFGQQKLAPKPEKAEVEEMLKTQVAMAEQQRTELVVASQSERFDWISLTFWGFGTLAVISSVILLIQRRRH
jgi:hypothetical protein